MIFVVTGGRGFIGSHFVERALEENHTVVDIDKMGYASHHQLPWDNDPNYTLIRQDISEIDHLPLCDVLVNFAAESHVDNSINNSFPFIKSNILGAHRLLELVRGQQTHDRPLFVHISTDEVYGDCTTGSYNESDRLAPSNPYSASKSCAEMLVLAHNRTYGIDYLITRSSNNYGLRQYEEKLIPKCIASIKKGKKIPIHGDGSYVRDWIYVKDNVDAIFFLIERGIRNDIINIAAKNYLTNLEVVKQISDWHGSDDSEYLSRVSFVENRWGQDLRYSVDVSKINSMGWKAKHTKGIHKWF